MAIATAKAAIQIVSHMGTPCVVHPTFKRYFRSSRMAGDGRRERTPGARRGRSLPD
jgi:hypothetical protein